MNYVLYYWMNDKGGGPGGSQIFKVLNKLDPYGFRVGSQRFWSKT